MKLFISWSGRVSEQAAQALREWLPNVIQSIEPFHSSEDIRKGQRWSAEIGNQLEGTSFGILCVTPSNAGSPWLNYEAGALSKNIGDAKVIPLVFGMRPGDLPAGPLTQFQGASTTEEDVLKIVTSLNEAGNQPLPDDRLKMIFEKWWPDLDAELKKVVEQAESGEQVQAKTNPASDPLIEVLELVRAQSRILANPNELLPPSYVRDILLREGRLLQDPEGKLALEALLDKVYELYNMPHAPEMTKIFAEMERVLRYLHFRQSRGSARSPELGSFGPYRTTTSLPDQPPNLEPSGLETR